MLRGGSLRLDIINFVVL